MGSAKRPMIADTIAPPTPPANAAMIPAMNFSGLLYPVSTLEGANYWLAWGFPSAWFQLISLGGFTKGLGWAAFAPIYPVLLLFTLAYVALASVLLKKQER